MCREPEILKKMDDKREVELDAVKKNALASAYSACLYVALPVVVNIVSFIVFVALGGELTATRAFTSLTLFELLQQPLNTLPRIVQAGLELSISVDRIRMFMLAEEQSELMLGGHSSGGGVDSSGGTKSSSKFVGGGASSSKGGSGGGGTYKRSMSPTPDGIAVSIVGGAFKWSKVQVDEDSDGKDKGKGKGSSADEPEKEEGCLEMLKPRCCKNKKKEAEWWELDAPELDSIAPTLSGVNMRITAGSLTCVIGKVGSGKSSLLAGMLNECPAVEGSVCLNGSVGFCTQVLCGLGIALVPTVWGWPVWG